ncbi:Melibiose operon regulatory protein [Megamonas hypermegale]|uniref:Melibiose operon regulatory protein n=1 Tax=Megamonas hypermegale TaxID=158847 RepID=A0A239TIX4_9FIRM|nr:AraC family transcriptional regulator [Megamonas hypermegale]SNU96824.1 Melibiose operon regulatory protein [Megamonas hypermegale]
MDRNQHIMERKTSSKELYLLSCGWEKCTSIQSYGPAVRNYYMLHFVLEGSGFYFIEDKSFKVNTGQCFLVEPGNLTFYKAESTNPWTYTWICFNGSIVPELLVQCHFTPNQPVVTLSSVQSIAKIIRSMMHHDKLTPANECYIHSELYLLFAKLQEDLHANYNAVELNDNFYITKAIEYIEKNTFTDLSVKNVARYLNISRSYLYALFERELHTSPQQFLMNAKIANARELLRKSTVPVASVALSCGYKNAFAFSRAFKQATGMSPQLYRKTYYKPKNLLNS